MEEYVDEIVKPTITASGYHSYISAMKNNNIEPKSLRFVSKTPNDAPWLFLIEGKKGSKPFMKVLPQLYVRNENGFTDEMMSIYKV